MVALLPRHPAAFDGRAGRKRSSARDATSAQERAGLGWPPRVLRHQSGRWRARVTALTHSHSWRNSVSADPVATVLSRVPGLLSQRRDYFFL